MCSRLVWGMDFKVMTDKATGKPILPDPADETGSWSEGFISSPYAFPVGWKARDAQRVAVINAMYEEAQEEWRTRGMRVDER